MIVAALDLATTTGFCSGSAWEGPAATKSGAVRLKKPSEPVSIAPRNLLQFLEDRFFTFESDCPDLVVLEDFMNPAGQPSADAAIMQLKLHGVAEAICGAFCCRIEVVRAETWRKHALGMGRMPGVRGQPKSKKERYEDRKELKRLAVKRAQLLGYMPSDAFDDNRAEACLLWDYAVHTFCRQTPKKLHLFGEGA